MTFNDCENAATELSEVSKTKRDMFLMLLFLVTGKLHEETRLHHPF